MRDVGWILVLVHAALAAATLAAFAALRPPPPARLAGKRGPLALAARWATWTLRPALRAARALRLSPTAVTVAGVVLSALSAWPASYGEWGVAAVLLLWGSACDLLDGELARTTGAETPAGAFLDSSLDRISELALFAGIAVGIPWRSGTAWALAALAASFMVSYARARGEGLGVSCPSFGLERPHRLVIVLAAMLVAPFLDWRKGHLAVELACLAVAVGAGATALGRIVVIHRLLRRGAPPGR